MKAYILDYITALRFKPTEPTLAIRIFDPSARPDKQPSKDWMRDELECWDNGPTAPFDKSQYAAVHQYTFSDVDTEHPDKIMAAYALHYALENPHLVISKDIANKIIHDFNQAYQKVDTVMLHCNMGVYRSPAVALALEKLFNLRFEWQGRAAFLIPSYQADDFVGNFMIYNTLLHCGNQYLHS